MSEILWKDYFMEAPTKEIAEKKEQVKSYWTRRSHDFAELRKKELNSPMAELWLAEILRYLPTKEKLRILDIGTGSGFFALLLAGLGHHVVGIDLTPSMIEEADMLCARLKSTARFQVMDAEALDFEEGSFDMVVSRNLTWTLPDVQKAYREWHRVLRKDGVLLNFDANYGTVDDAKDDAELPENHAHKQMDMGLRRECNVIKSQLEVSCHVRPAWDVQLLERAGFRHIELDLEVSRRVYREINEFYNPTPLFSICAVK